jgi:hypothetical protein
LLFRRDHTACKELLAPPPPKPPERPCILPGAVLLAAVLTQTPRHAAPEVCMKRGDAASDGESLAKRSLEDCYARDGGTRAFFKPAVPALVANTAPANQGPKSDTIFEPACHTPSRADNLN